MLEGWVSFLYEFFSFVGDVYFFGSTIFFDNDESFVFEGVKSFWCGSVDYGKFSWDVFDGDEWVFLVFFADVFEDVVGFFADDDGAFLEFWHGFDFVFDDGFLLFVYEYGVDVEEEDGVSGWNGFSDFVDHVDEGFKWELGQEVVDAVE